jgi:predicted ArsR family transcriptional regulator
LPVVLLAAEAGREELYAAAIARAAGVTRMEATRQLDSLRRAGLLARAGQQPGKGAGRPAGLFRRIDAAAWEGLVKLGLRDRLRQA